MELTIFTPIYNRANTITRTYKSLREQTCKDFEWLIVDDGSTDNTQAIIESLCKEDNEFPIRYIKQPNGGKYRAYNSGLKNANGELFFCVDSDDWLPANSVETVLKYKDKLTLSDKLAGLTSLKEYPNHKLIDSPYCKDLNYSSLYDLELAHQYGERSLVFKTSIARQFMFPEETNEKFITESVIYDRYHGKYKFLVTNDILTTCEYQEDGLSSNPRKLMINNPSGYKLYYAQRINMTPYWIDRISLILRYHAFRKLSATKCFEYQGKYNFLVFLLSPFSGIMKRYYICSAK